MTPTLRMCSHPHVILRRRRRSGSPCVYRATTRVCWLVSAIVLITALPVSAQSTINHGWTAGATVGRFASPDEYVSGSGLDLGVNLNAPVGRWHLRVEFGRARWTVDQRPVNDLEDAVHPPERLDLTRFTAAVLKPLRDTHIYVGAGGGFYRFAAERSDLPRPTRPGVYGVGGFELPVSTAPLHLRMELQLHAVGNPNAAVPVGPGPPVTQRNPPGIVRNKFLLTVGVNAGIAWRF
ncbi:MAG: hypothetical protein IT178_01480 [Acidobacteria bacterium]|nr:hypothetical protein [Acidobacteriota bacterium]